MKKTDVLLMNLGTPDQCDPSSVRKYLREFLNDERVIDLPAFIRWPLINGLIVPFRYRKTAAAYQKIWSETGSPLLSYSLQLKEALGVALGDDYIVELGMRYGQPSVAQALSRLKEADSLIAIPLYPQYSSAATGSAIEDLLMKIKKQWNIPNIKIKKDFYDDMEFISAYSEMIKKNIEQHKPDFVLFSYHGLPERHIRKSHCKAACDHLHACPSMQDSNRNCYRAQCYATTQALVDGLKLRSDQYDVAFQSRLGRTPWIKPYMDLVLPTLFERGVRHLAMVCPSFVTDCLETLEEVNIRARSQWLALGGHKFTFIPCLNASQEWVGGVAEMVKAL